ncbi:MAG: PEP-CTERM sorting domain-containing protein [Pirellulaceae bacterium]|nr:PEP-CTERM sorting domain-containing protein [Pirellulaceae bacterium]
MKAKPEFKITNVILLTMLICMAWFSPSVWAQSRTEAIVRTGDAAPDGNGSFGAVFGEQLNNFGQVSFTSSGMLGTSGGTTDNSGVYRGGAGGLVQVDRKNSNVFGFGFGQSHINDSGRIAYDVGIGISSGDPLREIRFWDGNATTIVATEPAGAGNEVGGVAGINGSGQVPFLFEESFTQSIQRFGGGGLVQIVQQGQSAPGGSSVFTQPRLATTTRRVINEAGQVAFYSRVSGGANGVFRGDGVNLNQIARVFQAAPDGNGSFSDFENVNDFQPSINDAGQVAFIASISGTSSGLIERGVFVGDGTTITQFARSGQASPDGNGSFLAFAAQDINNNGQVAFLGVLGQNDVGIFRASSGGITRIGRTGDAAFDGNGFFSTSFATSLSQNDAGQVAFIASTAETQGGLPTGEGLFTSDGIDNLTVIRTGDSLGGSTVAGLVGSRIALNQPGQIAYRAVLANGNETIQLWTPDLHWRNSGSGSWDTGHNWTLGLNPAAVHDVFIDPGTNSIITGPSNDANVRSLMIGGGGGHAMLVLNGSELALAPNGNDATVLTNGTLAGSGQINGDTHVFGAIAPGISAGHLSFQGTLFFNGPSSLLIELGGLDPVDFDRITVFNDLFLDGSLSVSLLGSHTLGANDYYLIGDVGGTLSGQFNGLAEGSLVGNFSGRNLFITYTGGNGNDIALYTAVPEPGSGIMMFCMVTGWLAFCRRKKRVR